MWCDIFRMLNRVSELICEDSEDLQDRKDGDLVDS